MPGEAGTPALHRGEVAGRGRTWRRDVSSVLAALRKDAVQRGCAHRCSARGPQPGDLRRLPSQCRLHDAWRGGGRLQRVEQAEAERSGPAWSFWKGFSERLWRTHRAELRPGLSRGMGTCQCLFALSPNAMGDGGRRHRLVCFTGPDLGRELGFSGRGRWRGPPTP